MSYVSDKGTMYLWVAGGTAGEGKCKLQLMQTCPCILLSDLDKNILQKNEENLF